MLDKLLIICVMVILTKSGSDVLDFAALKIALFWPPRKSWNVGSKPMWKVQSSFKALDTFRKFW